MKKTKEKFRIGIFLAAALILIIGVCAVGCKADKEYISPSSWEIYLDEISAMLGNTFAHEDAGYSVDSETELFFKQSGEEREKNYV